jgi:hypothetical protein
MTPAGEIAIILIIVLILSGLLAFYARKYMGLIGKLQLMYRARKQGAATQSSV